MGRAAVGPAVLALGGLLLSGCGGSAPSGGAPVASAPSLTQSPSVPALPEVPGITAEAVRLRTDEAVGGQVQVRITNTGDAPFRVTSVAIDSPGFAALPATAEEADYAPGRTIDLPTPFGSAVCGAAADPSAARITVVRPSGSERLVVPLAGTTLALIHREECDAAAVSAVVDVRVADLVDAPAAVTGTLVVARRTGSEPVVLTFLGRSVVLEPQLGEPLPLTLAAGQAELRVPVTFSTERCDPHALAETKQPFLFPLRVAVGGRPDVPVHLPLDDAQRTRLQDLLGRGCRSDAD
jgi:hypothetical protein